MPTIIHPTAEVSIEARIGDKTHIWNQAQIRSGAVIGESCVIGKNVYIDKGVKIGNGVKIQNNVNVYSPATIEDDVFIGPNSTLTNDAHPRAFLWDESRRAPLTTIRKGASIGAGAVLLCGISIGQYSMIAAGAVVTENVPAHALVKGVPARFSGYVCRCGHLANKNTDTTEYICTSCKEPFTP